MTIAVIVLALYSLVVTCIALYQRSEYNIQHTFMNQMLYAYSQVCGHRDQLAAENWELAEIESKRAEAMNVINGKDK